MGNQLLERTVIGDVLAIDFEDDIAAAQAGLRRGALRLHRCDDYTTTAGFDTQTFRNLGRQVQRKKRGNPVRVWPAQATNKESGYQGRTESKDC